jgi:7-cyano-7-deazaguanine synthase in queuosine biosynthesis
MSLSDEICLSNYCYTTDFPSGKEEEVVPVDKIRKAVRELKKEMLTAFCMKPDVEFCGECGTCKKVEASFKEKLGEKLA